MPHGTGIVCGRLKINLPPRALPAGKKRWVGSNDWQGLPAVRVALGVRSEQLVSWVLGRLTR